MMIFIFPCFVWLLMKDLQTVAWANRQRCLRLWSGSVVVFLTPQRLNTYPTTQLSKPNFSKICKLLSFLGLTNNIFALDDD
ncbi:hypothetical protein TorRG33x02_124150 [Trema orientale]|uniref:Secreted protein n=1 Tax=Trema orientale TaxID=63057 RepID=A0A2P5F200_TREOI|nr:hypothetical protein TorRG33x02_124150 [Trema orientale]